jgi:hypothetical protein
LEKGVELAERNWTIVADLTGVLTVPKKARAELGNAVLCYPNAREKPYSDMVFPKALREMDLGQRAAAHEFRTVFRESE